MDELAKLLADGEPQERQAKEVNFGMTSLHISKFAFDKAFRYAQLVMKRKKRSVEVGGLLSKPKDATDRVARNAYLVKDQDVRESFYELSPEGVLRARKDLEELGEVPVGWWHSHGRMGTFHSNTDDDNQLVTLNQIAPFNYITKHVEKTISNLETRIDGSTVTIFDPSDPSRKFAITLKDEDPELVAEKLKLTEEKRIGFTYSFVVNHHRWKRFRVPYCELATRDLCTNCLSSKEDSIKVPYQLFDEDEVFKLDNDAMNKEIDERVFLFGDRVKKFFLPEHWRGRSKGTLVDPNTVDKTHFKDSRSYVVPKSGTPYKPVGGSTQQFVDTPSSVYGSQGSLFSDEPEAGDEGSSDDDQGDFTDFNQDLWTRED